MISRVGFAVRVVDEHIGEGSQALEVVIYEVGAIEFRPGKPFLASLRYTSAADQYISHVPDTRTLRREGSLNFSYQIHVTINLSAALVVL